mgnify:CR=1 FL=1
MINTNRLFLRPISIEDNTDVFTYRSDAETNKYQGWIAESLEQIDSFILKNPKTINIPDTWFQLAILKKETNTIIGDIGIHFIGNDNNSQVELGCTLNKEYHGNGYAQEALQAIITYAFTDLKKHRITASIDPRNIPSLSLFNRLGFRKEAHFKKSMFFKGEWVDDIVYACLKSEWNEQNKT